MERGEELIITTDDLGALSFPLQSADGDDLILAVRPEKLRVGRQVSGEVVVDAKLGDVAFQGDHSGVELIMPHRSLLAAVHGADAKAIRELEEETAVKVAWDRADMLVLPRG